MQEINVYDKSGSQIKALWQWDTDVQITVRESAIKAAYDVHFFNDKSEVAYVVHSTYSNGTLTAKIPNVLLRESRPIIGCVYVSDGTTSKTEYYFVIVIRKRARPSDYINVSGVEIDDYVSISSIRLDCSGFATEAEASMNEAEDQAVLAKSYAVGGTGTRSGENTDNAKYYAQQADASEAAALASANKAKTSESNAAKSAAASATSADQSAASASAAQTSKNAAAASATNAKNSETAASEYSTAANQSKTAAATSASQALTHKNAAATSEQNAKSSELAAKQSEETVLGTIDEAEASANLAESWAIGGTGTRSGEDTNNSKYFSQQSNQHRASAQTQATASKSYAVGGTGSRTGEDTDNAKYYYTQLQTMMGNLTFATVDEAKTYIGY